MTGFVLTSSVFLQNLRDVDPDLATARMALTILAEIGLTCQPTVLEVKRHPHKLNDVFLELRDVVLNSGECNVVNVLVRKSYLPCAYYNLVSVDVFSSIPP